MLSIKNIRKVFPGLVLIICIACGRDEDPLENRLIPLLHAEVYENTDNEVGLKAEIIYPGALAIRSYGFRWNSFPTLENNSRVEFEGAPSSEFQFRIKSGLCSGERHIGQAFVTTDSGTVFSDYIEFEGSGVPSEIFSITPEVVRPGDSIVVTGKFFGHSASLITGTINNINLDLVEFGNRRLVFKIPEGVNPGTYLLWIRVCSTVTKSRKSFEISEP